MYSFDADDPAWLTGPTQANGLPTGNAPYGFHRRTGSTPSGGTGPSSGRKGGADDGYYYAEATGSLAGSVFRLQYVGSDCAAQGLIGELSFWFASESRTDCERTFSGLSAVAAPCDLFALSASVLLLAADLLLRRGLSPL
jgi:hypothetical protein